MVRRVQARQPNTKNQDDSDSKLSDVPSNLDDMEVDDGDFGAGFDASGPSSIAQKQSLEDSSHNKPNHLTPPSHNNTNSPLLRLPRELRDIIYEYALTEEGGLVADVCSNDHSPTWFRAAKSTDKSQESNQLRRTCRQLFIETTTLGILYNNITFIDTYHVNRVLAYQHFTRFVEESSRRQLEKIGRITIVDSDIESWRTSQLLRKCCLKYPVQRFCMNFPRVVVVIRYGQSNVGCLASTEKTDGFDPKSFLKQVYVEG